MTLDPLYISGVLALGIAAQWLAWRLKLPAIVLLLVFGFALGASGVRPPSDDIIFPFVSLAVGVILFEGGLSLQFRELKETGHVVTRLVTVGLLVTWLATAVAAHWLIGFGWKMSGLLGALLTVSGPTVILPLIRQVRPEKRIGSVIKWEGIVNDPIGAVLAALAFEYIAHGDTVAESAQGLVMTAVVGIVLGVLAATIVIQLHSRFLVPDYLQNAAILSLVVLVFAVSNEIQHESGLVTVTVMGLLLANQPWVRIHHVLEFKENLRVLLLSVLFIVLSSRVEISAAQLAEFGLGGAAFIVAIIVLIRPAAVLLATAGTDLTRNERLLLGWIHPRGIVAAAVASLLATELAKKEEFAGDAEMLVLATFLVIVGTVVVYGLTLGPVARRLGLSREDPQGVLFAGAAPMVREIASALKSEGFQTLLVDTNMENIAAARMAGLPVYYGSIGSERVHNEADLGGIGRMLAMTPNDEINSIAAMEFAERLGSANAYQLAQHESRERHQRVPHHRRGRTLFREGITYDVLADRFEKGHIIKKSTLTEDYTIEDFRAKYPNALILFTVPEKGRLRVAVVGHKLDPRPGKKLVALVEEVEGSGVDLRDTAEKSAALSVKPDDQSVV
ncbi:K(+)/H(+) antiporter NhaP2 [Posidoniimonas polymericola]|uniref:K(+)/H(+) antiporter NhaP2 n=1 Tax=Posidoniimonas polymericola TaxID=2528002 RepID=A0A5C5YVA2_9BACT|nr:sodium:proton antiporter [Posidoniimonas polymericola]TWT78457.1 K(+)/H(+) antiporter NhaP2 [Posidoniimonas polymericola]